GAAPGDELEYWLSDLRTDLAADPPGSIDTDPPGPHQTSHEPDQAASPNRFHSDNPRRAPPRPEQSDDIEARTDPRSPRHGPVWNTPSRAAQYRTRAFAAGSMPRLRPVAAAWPGVTMALWTLSFWSSPSAPTRPRRSSCCARPWPNSACPASPCAPRSSPMTPGPASGTSPARRRS